MRKLLRWRGYTLSDGVWRKTGSNFEVRDDEVEDKHEIIVAKLAAVEVRYKAKTLYAWITGQEA